MDILIAACVVLAAICCFVFCTLRLRSSFALTLFAWCAAIPWLSVIAIWYLWNLSATDVLTWNGDVQIDPVTIAFACIAFSLVVLGGTPRAART